MANTIKVSVLGDVRDINRKMGQVTNQLGGFQKTSKRVGGLVKGLFAGLAVGQAVQGIKAVVSSASDAQQSLGATETVFGKYADGVIANSKRAATAIGLSANEYRELSNVTGALLSGAGVPLKRLGGLTDDINKRAADMAATFGGTTKEAVEAISSLMKGEADPIERYGVSIKQSDINARLAAKGQDKLTGAARKQAEMQARLDMLMQKSAKTRGAFGKETNTLAHQQQVLGAQWENLKATLGAALLPVLTSVFKVINDNLMPAFKATGAFLKPLVAGFKDFFNTGSGGASALAPFVDFIKGSLIPAFLGIYSSIQSLVATVLPIAQQFGTTLLATWRQIQPQVASIWASIKAIIVGVMRIIARVIQIGTGIIKAVWQRVGATILAFVSSTFKNMANVIDGAMKVIRGVVKVVLSLLKGDWKGAWNGIKQILSGAWQVIKAVVRQGINTVKTVISLAWSAVKALTSAAWNGIKAAVSAGINKMMSLIRGIPGLVKGVFSGAGGWLVSAGMDILHGLGAGIDAAWDWIKSKIDAIADKIPGWLRKRLGIASPSKVMKRLAKWIPIGIAKGIEGGIKDVKAAMKKVTGAIAKIAKDKAPKHAGLLFKWVTKAISNESRALKTNARARERVSKSLAVATKRLEDLKKARADYSKNVKNSVIDYGNVTDLNAAFNADAIAQALKARIDKTRQYVALLSRLKSLGLNKTMYDDLVQAGVEGGLATAQALANGGKAAVKQMNNLQTQMDKQASTLGKQASGYMYDAGVRAAQGLVNGLTRSKASLERAAQTIARSMVKEIKRILKIKSPSRVFRDIGRFTVEGLQIGLEDTTGVRQSMVTLSKTMTSSFDPNLKATARAERAGSGGVQITVNVPPTADKASIGREVANALDAYYKQGGRRASV